LLAIRRSGTIAVVSYNYKKLTMARKRKAPDKQDPNYQLYLKIYEFHRRGVLRQLGARVSRVSSGHSVKGLVKASFTIEDLIAKHNNKCYLTGRDIDLGDSKSYQLDHIDSASSGGDSTLENCGLSCKQANWAKGDMTLEEFFELCVDVVKHNNLL
jgi:5-methylcytosine-specific restriction endonuclease McrA